MRFFTLAVLCISLLLVAPLSASAKSKKDKGPEMIAKLLAKVIEAAGDRVSTETEMGDSESIGDGNEIVEIESLVLNINIGDIVINSNESKGDGGATELAFRLLDFMGMAHEKMGKGMGMPMHPGKDMKMHPGMDNPHGNVPMMGGSKGIGNPHGNMPKGHPDMGMIKGGHGKGHPKMDGHGNMPKGHPDMGMKKGGHGEGHPKMDGYGNMPKGHPDMGMKKGGHGDMRRDMPNFDENPGFHPEVWEMLHEIPLDVDPGFFRTMMCIAGMAWERPELRERLEQMVRRMEEGENDRRPHGR